jgi:hypothetical protein
MSGKKLIRRFEPRYGVSQTMIDAECRYVGRELEDYLLLSTDDLRKQLADLQKQIAKADEELSTRLCKTPDRERLALRSMLARDFWHIAVLYQTLLASPAVADATGHVSPSPTELTKDERPASVLSFAKTLFD